MRLLRPAGAALVLLGTLAVSPSASAATRGSALLVSTEVAPTCKVTSAPPGASGAAVPGGGGPAISLTCTKGVFATLTTGPSGERPTVLHAAGAGSPRPLAIGRRIPTTRRALPHHEGAPLIAIILF